MTPCTSNQGDGPCGQPGDLLDPDLHIARCTEHWPAGVARPVGVTA